MNASPPDDPIHSLATRKALVIVLAVPIIAAFTAILLEYKGFIDVEEFGLPENYLFIGGFAVIVLAVLPLLLIWRCPACRAYLGRELHLARCPACGARFQ